MLTSASPARRNPFTGTLLDFESSCLRGVTSNIQDQLNNVNGRSTQYVTAAAGTTTLTANSPLVTVITGANYQTIVLPDVTTCYLGQSFVIVNWTPYWWNDVKTHTSAATFGKQYSYYTSTYTVRALTGDTIASWYESHQYGDTQYNETGMLDLIGGRLFFPSTQNASTNVNCLDDYEEGTWTPTVYGSSTAGVGTYTTQVGTYTKIGRVVSFSTYVNISAHTGTGNMNISGLPFTSAGSSNYTACAVAPSNIALTAGNYAVSYISPSSSIVGLYQAPTGGGALATVPIDVSFYVMISGSYIV